MKQAVDPLVTVTFFGLRKRIYGRVNDKVWFPLYRSWNRKKGGCETCPLEEQCQIHVSAGHFCACEAPLQSEIDGKLV